MAEREAVVYRDVEVFRPWRRSASLSSTCEGPTAFRGEGTSRAERLGYESDIWTSRQSYSQGLLDTCFASASPWQHCLQEIMVSWSGSKLVHLEWENISSMRQM